MLKRNHKCSTAKGPSPCESNFEARASSSQRTRVRQLNLTTSLLNRLANANPNVPTPLCSLPHSSTKIINITRDFPHLPLLPRSPSPPSHIISGSEKSTTSPTTHNTPDLPPVASKPHISLPLNSLNDLSTLSQIQPVLFSSDGLVSHLSNLSPLPEDPPACPYAPDCPPASLSDISPQMTGSSVAPSISPKSFSSGPLFSPHTPLLPLSSSGSLLAPPTSLLPLSSSGPLVASSTSLLPLSSSGPLVAPSTSLLPHPSSGPLVAPSTSLLPHSSSGPLVATPTCTQVSPSSNICSNSSVSSTPPLVFSSSTDPSLPAHSTSTAQERSSLVIPTPKGISLSSADIKRLLSVKRIKDEWFPGRRIETHFEPSLSRFIVKASRVCKRGSCNLGLFLKDDASPISPSVLIGYYTGRVSSGKGPYHLD